MSSCSRGFAPSEYSRMNPALWVAAAVNRQSAPAIDLRSTMEACAHSLSSWAHWKKTLPFPCCEARYETLVTEPERETRRVM